MRLLGGFAEPAAQPRRERRQRFVHRRRFHGCEESSHQPAGLGRRASALTSTIDGAYNKGEWQTFCIHGFTGDGSAYQPFPLASFTDAVKTEKQKKDLWIDTMQAVGAYWRAGRAFAKATKTTSGSDTTWKWTVAAHIPPNTCLRVKPDGGVVKQKGAEVPWDDHGYYEISFNAGEVTLSAQ